MKVVVTSQGPDTSSVVEPVFRRARFFLLCDTETAQAIPYDNQQNLDTPRGTGILAGQLIAFFDADAVVTGNIGHGAVLALRSRGLTVYVGATGLVRDALADLRGGRLRPHPTSLRGQGS